METASGRKWTLVIDNITRPVESAEALAQRIRASLKKDEGIAKRGSLVDAA